MAPTVARSTLSTRTVTLWRTIVVARSCSLVTKSASCSRVYWRRKRKNETTMIGATTRTNQAPCVNFTTEKMITITSETDPARKLITTRTLQPSGFTRIECLVIPKPANAKPVNTPSA